VFLLAGAGLLVRTLIHLQTLPPGFTADGVMTARASLDNTRYQDAAAFRKLLDESTEAFQRTWLTPQASQALCSGVLAFVSVWLSLPSK
jgi:hypothetical protein